MTFSLGSLTTVPASEKPHLLAAPVRAQIESLNLGEQIGVVEIDPDLADTRVMTDAYGLDLSLSVNCVIVSGKREGKEHIAACVAQATTRVDVNQQVKKTLNVRKASFMRQEDAVALSEMEYGGITPIGLPAQMRLLVDSRIRDLDAVIIGSGLRRSKVVLPGPLLCSLPDVEIIKGLSHAA